jgi:lysophospholipase L1-like esterase
MKKLFVIGDSISCYYGKHLEPMLAGRFAYDRKGGTHKLDNLDDGTDGVNGGDTSMVIAYLKEIGKVWKEKAPDYLLLNCGLHDLKTAVSPAGYQVPAEAYEANLHAILDSVRKFGIALIWVRTTPIVDLAPGIVPDDFMTIRANSDVIQYNAVADRVMSGAGVPIIDLYSFTCNLGPDLYFDRGVHFNEPTAAKQAAFIAGALWPMGEPK